MIANTTKLVEVHFSNNDQRALTEVESLLEEMLSIMNNESINSLENVRFYFTKEDLVRIFTLVSSLRTCETLHSKIDE